MTSLRIALADEHPTIRFAAAELQRYLAQATGQAVEVLHDDLQLLDRIGLGGFSSCQVQRAFFPTGLPMAVLG